MAPPGFGPPGYAIPQRYRNRTPPPEGADTNTRPYLIFFSYLLTCFSVATFIVVRIVRKHSALKNSKTARGPPAKHVWLFATLGVGSLVSTSTFMFRYFKVSYQTWLMWRSYYELDPQHRHWGLWLRETSLFQETWELAIIGNARYWWTHQIFFFALFLGLYLEQNGIQRGIKYTWAFMLLAQIVAVSFATNLFFLILLLSPPTSSSTPSNVAVRSRWLGVWLLNLGAVFGTAIPAFLLADEYYWHHPTGFLPVILTPHIALLALPFARLIVPTRYLANVDVAFNDRVYGYMWALSLGNAGLMLLKTTWTAYSYAGFTGIQSALLEHPAVSIMAFDTIICWTTWICWYWVQQSHTSPTGKAPFHSTGEMIEDDAAGSAFKSTSSENDIRRR